MLHHIENEFLSCTIESVGAELRSMRDKTSGKEFIWPIKPDIWGSSAPVLFPAIGSIREGHWRYQGKSFPMTKHGIIRNNAVLKFEQIAKNACSFSLESSTATQLLYPFDFQFKVDYVLLGRDLKMIYTIQNLGKLSMPFSCGGHTAYFCPLDAHTRLEDYRIEFPTRNEIVADTLAASGLLGYRKRSYSLQNGALTLSADLFNEDALIFADIDFDHVILHGPKPEDRIEVWFKGYPNLALWAKPGADYVCIEPWLGLPDREDTSTAVLEKDSFKLLEAGQQFQIEIISKV